MFYHLYNYKAKLAKYKQCNIIQFLQIKVEQISSRKYLLSVCDYNGKQYKVGENFPKGDGCNNCSCAPNGRVNCGEKYCRKGSRKLS